MPRFQRTPDAIYRRPRMIQAIGKLVRGESLTEAEAAQAMDTIMAGDATPAQIAGFMVALRMKGETIEEITGLARTVRAHATPMQAPADVLDVVGTGGDGLGTFNISTLSAIVAAACGAPVAKHGNRAASSLCGSADVLEALGVKIDLGPEGVARCIDEAGIGFMFAPLFHPSFKYAGGPRRELGVRTVFNILGPLCNPAHAPYQALGVAETGLADRVVEVLSRLGVKRVLVFHASDGMDELSVSGPSRVVEILDGKRSEYELDPTSLGLPRSEPGAVRGGTPAENAAIAREVLDGAHGPRRDVVLLNAAAALRAAGRARDWQEGLALAGRALDEGDAGQVLERWIAVSQSAATPTPA
jgi:anthranilate phosphoribosyltransferase